jgi:hypothetical protein
MNEFFVGYAKNIPPGIGRVIRLAICIFLAGSAGVGITLVHSQKQFPAAAFEYTETREFEGVIEERPFPALLVDRPGQSAPDTSYTRFLLVAEGKHGAGNQVSGYSGRRTHLRGKLIYRDAGTIIEVASGSLADLGPQPALQDSRVELGATTLSGEIVDTKCFLGVMNPGQGKVHSDCAARCIAGGIPPALLVQGTDGRNNLYFIVDGTGNPFPPLVISAIAGKPISLRGVVTRDGDTMYLRIARPPTL